MDTEKPRPLVALPPPFDGLKVYADSPEYAHWIEAKEAQDWGNKFLTDIETGQVQQAEGIARIDAFLAKEPSQGLSQMAQSLSYIRASYAGNAEVRLGRHLMALRRHLDALNYVVGATSFMPRPDDEGGSPQYRRNVVPDHARIAQRERQAQELDRLSRIS
ncbi:hypothetical protein [Variovorax soli]|uniref:hypothetical protein n=1 Tax=Variovorax soli TaxID=376815 RepID=UPI000837BDDC|nr:hypothetical protein [Variovorax soli]